MAIGALCVFPLGLPAMAMGVNALRHARELDGAGRGPALAAIVIGAIGFAVGFVVFALLI